MKLRQYFKNGVLLMNKQILRFSKRSEFLDDRYLRKMGDNVETFMSARKQIDLQDLQKSIYRNNELKFHKNMVNQKLQISYDFNGNQEKQKLKKQFDFLVLQDDIQIKEYFKNRYFDYLQRMVNKNMVENVSINQKQNNLQDFEINFLINSQKSLEDIEIDLFIEEDKNEFSKFYNNDEVKIIEVQTLRGVYSDRGMNLNTEFYSINKKEEKEGFMNFVSMGGESVDQFRERNKKMLMRVLVQIVSSRVLKGRVKDQGDQLLGDRQNHQWMGKDKEQFVHFMILENQLILPPQMAFYKQTNSQLVSQFKLSPNWRIVDVDYFMHANPLLYNPNQAQFLYRESPFIQIDTTILDYVKLQAQQRSNNNTSILS